MAEEEWRDLAACKGLAKTERGRFLRDEIFFEETRGQNEKAATREAREMFCDRCRVSEQCLEYAIANKIDYGIWGGHSVVTIKRIRRARRKDG